MKWLLDLGKKKKIDKMITPTEDDVLCGKRTRTQRSYCNPDLRIICCLTNMPPNSPIFSGKDRDSVNWSGSVRFRDVVDAYAHRYATASSKFEKMAITKTIYEKVSRVSRFLKYNEAENVWEEITMMAARDKIGHR